MEADLPTLGLPDVRAWCGDRSFELGQQYFRDGMLSRLRQQGMALKGRCQGTAPQPYRVEAILSSQGIATAECSCPVGEGGRCKHAAALLVAWLETSEDFVAMEALDVALGRLAQAELITLIRRMVRRAPNLEDWLELELPALSGVATQWPMEAGAIRRQVKAAMRGFGGGYGRDYHDDGWGWNRWSAEIENDLQPLLGQAEDSLTHGDRHSAAIVYLAVAETAMEEYEGEEDYEGEVAGDVQMVVSRCVAGLDDCLDGMTDPDDRAEVLRGLFDLWRGDSEGYDLSDEEGAERVILERATPEERRFVAGLVRAELPEGNELTSVYRHQLLGRFLLALEVDELDDETYLRICRQTGQMQQLVERLVALGRVPEAAVEVRGVEEVGHFLALIEVLRACGQPDMAEHLVRQRARTSQDDQLTMWLKDRAKESGDTDEALALAETLFWRGPSVHNYEEVRELALRLGTWDKVQPGIFSHLARGRHFTLITELQLLEGRVDEALEALGQVGEAGAGWGYYSGYGGNPLRIRVAEAAARTRPAEAIRLYLREAERLIQAQGREHYATAATHLTRVKALHAAQGQEDEWRRLIAELRANNKRLRALQDELNKAGL